MIHESITLGSSLSYILHPHLFARLKKYISLLWFYVSFLVLLLSIRIVN